MMNHQTVSRTPDSYCQRPKAMDFPPRLTPSLLCLIAYLGLASSCGAPKTANAPSASTIPSVTLPPTQTEGLEAAYIRSQQAQGQEDIKFHFAAVQKGTLTTQHHSQGWTARLDESGVGLTVGQHRFVLRAAQLECGGRQTPLPRAPVAGRADTRNRAEYRRGAVVEWYENGPLGLEQGFSIARAMDCENTPETKIVIELDGTLKAEARGQEAVLLAADKQPIAHYSHLWATDADGKQLPSRLDVANSGDRIALVVDTTQAVYPLEIDPLIYTQQVKITASEKAAYDFFGRSVALSRDGRIALIGSPGASESARGLHANGTAYVFMWSGGATWTQQQKLLPSDIDSDDMFGAAVALSSDGSTALVSAVHESDDTGSATRQNGAAYVFVRSGDAWLQQAKLLASDKADTDYFGTSAALSADGNTALLGAWGDEDSPGGPVWDSGAAYVFVRSGASWTQQAKLLASSGERTSEAEFGTSVALSSDGATALIGATGESDAAGGSTSYNGAAYVFVKSGSLWSLQSKLLANDKASRDQFGYSVALSASGDTALIGSLYQSDATGSATTNNGAAYVFERSGGLWNLQAKLLASDKSSYGWFGFSAALSADGNIAAIGARMDDDPGGAGTRDSGAAYVFRRAGAAWIEQAKLRALDRASGDELGDSLALSADGFSVLAGTSFASDGVTSTHASGAAYLFVVKPNGQSCAAGDECISGNCVDGVCCNSACGFGANDDCQACSTAKGAVLNGTCGPRLNGSVCRPASGVCDVTEVCDGFANNCPRDRLLPGGVECRPAAGPCDAPEVCSGSSSSCPADAMLAKNSVCRPAAGPCDAPEKCSGASPLCPSDKFKSSSTICRPAANSCDLDERCTGRSAVCPDDKSKPDDTPCPGGMCKAGMCI